MVKTGIRPERNPLNPRLGLSLLWLVTALVAACVTTHLKNSWKDPQFNDVPFRNVLVIGVSRSDANRRMFEDGLIQALRASGTEASASYSLLPEQGPLPKERIKQAVAKTGADSVLVTRVLRACNARWTSASVTSPPVATADVFTVGTGRPGWPRRKSTRMTF
ncbi:hypothetical protein [Methylocaldum sp.]|uniref:hypothetical protein n=1 Tax=Methylocaldum sp. TaxID=1969727 RepID=UPI002D6034F8|nr:hypothetical protein [Methylocaldum sp.]HYE34514.1 hypothetical protein [Methylocaldum sp.]